LIDQHIGDGWRLDLDQLGALRAHADDPIAAGPLPGRSSVPTRQRLAASIAATTGIVVDPTSLFDVQVKRIHEYKRQLLNRAAGGCPLAGHARRAAGRLGAAHGDLRRQGGLELRTWPSR
jgi:hypothetical protein